MRNPATGEVTILPSLGSDSTSVSAIMYAMDPSQVQAPPGASMFASRGIGAGALQRADPASLFTLLITDPAVLTNPYDSKFEARRDNWDFESIPIAWLPFLPGAQEGVQEEEQIDPSAGMIATALWYFEYRKADGPLYNRFRLQPDQAYSNKMGIRWAALANRDVPSPNAQVAGSYREWISDDPGVFAKTQFDALRVLFYMERERPIPVLLFDKSPVNDSAIVVAVGIATRVIGDVVRVVVANNSEGSYDVQLLPTGIRPFNILDRNGAVAFTVHAFSPVMNRTMSDGPGAGSNWGRVLAGTVGDAEGWPSPTLHFAKGELDTTAVFLADTLRFWWQCAGCPDYGFKPAQLPDASHLQVFHFGRKVGGAMGRFSTEYIRAGARWSGDSVMSDVTPTLTGHAVFLPQIEPTMPDKVLPGWLDWKTVTFKRTSLRPSPAALTIGQDTTATFTLSPTTALPAGTRYSWVLRTADGRDSTESAASAHTRNLKVDKPGKLLITAYEAGTKRPIARDSVEVKASEAAPFWHITSITDRDSLFDSEENEGGGPIADAFTRLLAAPRSGAITIETAGATTELRVRVRRASLWDPATCCPLPAFASATEMLLPLGMTPPVQFTLGAFFAGWGSNSWSQSTNNLSAGTLTGQYIPGTQSYAIKDMGTQVGPSGGIRINATRNGTAMTGEITVTIWWVDADSGMIETPPETFRFPFTATRMR